MTGKSLFIVSLLLVACFASIGWVWFGSESDPKLPESSDSNRERIVPPPIRDVRPDPKPTEVVPREPAVGQRDPLEQNPASDAGTDQPAGDSDTDPDPDGSDGNKASPGRNPDRSVSTASSIIPAADGGTGNPSIPPSANEPLIENGLRRVRIGADNEGAVVSETRRTVTRRSTGLMPNLPKVQDEPKRPVRGRVVERVGNELVGLPGVLVTGWRELHRTFTDENGAFEFEVRFADDSAQAFNHAERDQNPNNDFVELSAYADGYVLTGAGVTVNGDPGRRYYNGMVFNPQQVNSAAGLTLEMKWVGEEELKVRLTNPPSNPTSVVIVVESLPAHGAQLDEGFQVSAPANESGEARFRVPNRRHLEITAMGDNWRSRGPAAYNSQSGFWELTLTEASNMRISGRAIDVRTNGPAVGIRVRANTETTAAYTGADGSFELWVRRDQPSYHMIFEHPSYIRTNATVGANGSNDGRVSLTGAGYAPGGPWLVNMRPAVRLSATIQLAEGGMISKVHTVSLKAPDGPDRVVIAKAENGAAVLDIPDCPWGATGATMVLPSADGMSHALYNIEFQQSLWSNSNSVEARVFATKRQ